MVRILIIILIALFCVHFHSFAAYFKKQPAGTTYALVNSTVKIDCAISGSTMIPLWKINGTTYNIYSHPPNGVSYVPDGLLIHRVSLQWNYTSFQCYIFGLSSTIGYLYVLSKSLIFVLVILLNS